MFIFYRRNSAGLCARFLNCKTTMAQIGFTEKTEPVYDRFNKMRLAYAEEHGRTYAPRFMTVLMDAWEELERIAKSDDIVIITSENIVDRGQVVTDFLEQHFGGEKLGL